MPRNARREHILPWCSLTTLGLLACLVGCRASSNPSRAPINGEQNTARDGTPTVLSQSPGELQSDQKAMNGCACAQRYNLAQMAKARADALDKMRRLQRAEQRLSPLSDNARDAGTNRSRQHSPGSPHELSTSTPDLLPELPCWKTPGGAWAVVIKRATVCPRKRRQWKPWEARTRNTIAHVASGSCSVNEYPFPWPTYETFDGDSGFSEHELSCDAALSGRLSDPHPNEPKLFDFDGDGEPELWVAIGHEDWGEDGRRGTLLTLADGQVRKYPAPDLSYVAFEDADGDGRPDLVWNLDLGLADDCADHGTPVYGPRFIAHSLPDGRFSLDDEAARAYVRRWCPGPPKALQEVADVSCARLYGRTKASLIAELAAIPPFDCSSLKSNHELASLAPAMRTAAEVAPPFFLSVE